MSLHTIGQALSSGEGKTVAVDSPEGFPLFAYETSDRGWDVTAEPETITKETGAECFPCTVRVVGQDSAAFWRQKAALFQLNQRGKKLKFTEAEQAAIDTVAACVVGFDHIVWDDGSKGAKGYVMEFTPDNLQTLLTGYSPVFDKINAFIADRANFSTSA